MKPRFKRGRDPEYLAWIRTLPCVICGNFAEADHVRTRGAGGTDRQAVPLCHTHHMERHTIGIKTFQAKYGVDLMEHAHWYSEYYDTKRTVHK